MSVIAVISRMRPILSQDSKARLSFEGPQTRRWAPCPLAPCNKGEAGLSRARGFRETAKKWLEQDVIPRGPVTAPPLAMSSVSAEKTKALTREY